MILDCVVTACNNNPLYIEFIPYFIKAWKKLYPNVDVKVILISHNIPSDLVDYESNLILFEPLENISTAFISQYIRLLYPAILDYSNGILITDIDIIPMNRTYYTKNIENISNDKFIYLRDVLLDHNQIAMCYNVGLNVIWKEIFQINNIDDIINRIKLIYNSIEYIDGHGNTGWCTDQLDFYNYVMNWNNKTNNFVVLSDKNTGYCRLDRYELEKLGMLPSILYSHINNGTFSDYHCLRPFYQYKEVNNFIYDLL